MRLAPAIAALALLAAAPAAMAFGTIHGLGQDAEHEKITRLALDCRAGDVDCLEPRTLDVLAGKRSSFGMVGGPDSGSLLTQSSAHCDNGDWLDRPGYDQVRAKAQQALEACRAWIRANIEKAAARAAGMIDADGLLRRGQYGVACASYGRRQPTAKCEVLEALGAALHAAQDFYAHSNWVDRPAPGPTGPDNPPGLGNEGPAPWMDWRSFHPFPEGLISDCFGGAPERLFCNGGAGGRVKHAAINKDTGEIDVASGRIGNGTSPRGRVNGNFRRAVEAARGETRRQWEILQVLLIQSYGDAAGARIACALQNDKPGESCAG